jgi:hypothetical protein
MSSGTCPPMIQTDGLPFLAGLNEIVERMARTHHTVVNDPRLLALRRDANREPSWEEIRIAGYEAIKHVGAEIASAKTQAEAATARLRRDTYLQALDGANQALLTTAARRLAQGPMIDLTEGRFIGLVAYGRREIASPLEPIPPVHFEAGQMNWQARRLEGGGVTWIGIRILDLADIAPDQAEIIVNALFKIEDVVDTTSETGRSGGVPNVAAAQLDRFLSEYVVSFRPGAPELTERALWQAAKAKFPDRTVSRQQVRDWIKNEMDSSKRFQRGHSSTRGSTGTH